jgi:predicted phosphoribosyltransferase
MATKAPRAKVHEVRELRDQERVFRDRRHAGLILAQMLEGKVPAGARLLAIPAGGVPVAAAMAEALRLPLDVAVVSKITPSWNTEVGYGAVGFDGRVRVDEQRRRQLRVDERDVASDAGRAQSKVRRRLESLRSGLGPVVTTGDTAILVDDGLASGITMETAVEAVRDAGAGRIVVAVPTGSAAAVDRIAAMVDEVHCANVRTGWSFAVADAYLEWSDEHDETVQLILDRLRGSAS